MAQAKGDYPWAQGERAFYANAMPAGDPRNGVSGPMVAVREHYGNGIRERLYSRTEAERLRDELNAALRAFDLAESLAETVACRKSYPFRDHRTMEEVAAATRASAAGGVMSAVERAAALFTSIAASPVGVSARGLSGLAEEHGLDGEQLVDALAFLESSGMIEVISLVRVSENARMKREIAQRAGDGVGAVSA